MRKNYETERDGQIEFFDLFNIPYQETPVLIDNTDGVYNGNIFEFKLNITNLNKVLIQAIKYLSKMRIKGESVPATILLISLNTTEVYLYNSQDYFDEIHKIYFGPSSKDNDNFIAGNYSLKLNYSNSSDVIKLRKILKGKKSITEKFIPINIDENCIVGWAKRYYEENPKASKGDFLGDDDGTVVKITGEIRQPKHFKYLINPYTKQTNEKFKYLMDCLNDRLNKKDLGAFYTPEAYARKSAELVKLAVDRVPKGNDYVIIDRCAGTGNLEAVLEGIRDRNGDELLSHCILATYEYYEYKVLCERLIDKVRFIVPPSEHLVEYSSGKILNADAMNEKFINNEDIKNYINKEDCTVILFENPPYSDSSAITFTEDGDLTKRAKTGRKNSYVLNEFKKEIKKFNSQEAVAREISNLFIWSAFKYYLRQPTDSYIVYSPVKYYKNAHLINKKFIKGFAFNRKHFHATPSVISCILWSNENDDKEKIDLDTYDIKDGVIVPLKEHKLCIKQVKKNISIFNDKRKDENDIEYSLENGNRISVVGAKGYEKENWIYTKGRKPVYNDNIIAYMVAKSFMLDPKHYNLVRTNFDTGLKNSYGFWLRKDNFLELLPLFVAKLYPCDKWYEKDVYFTTADGGDKFKHDKEFLKSCLIYTSLSSDNRCISFNGTDGRYYKNELCLDYDTLANQYLSKYSLDEEETNLINIWQRIITESKNTKNYNPDFKYGVYQIGEELNTFHTIGFGKNEKEVPDYVELNGDLQLLRKMLKIYYNSHIKNKMQEYELIK